jgi:acetyl-CoA acetyltransferase
LTRQTGAAIVGLGLSDMGKIYDRSALGFGAQAIARALDNTGLSKSDVDGLLINSNGTRPQDASHINAQLMYGFTDLRVYNIMYAAGSTVGTMVQYAMSAIAAGDASTIVLVYADAPLQLGTRSGRVYRAARAGDELADLPGLYGFSGAIAPYAMGAMRHMHLYGTTSEQLGAIAVAQRSWAGMNPDAQRRDPINLEDHQRSRPICDPLRLLDCCPVTNGAIAVVVTGGDRARDLRQPPVHVWSTAQGAPGDNFRRGHDPWLTTGAATAGPRALEKAGISRNDIDMLQLYDCFTYTVLVTLEDYGFCPKGEGGPFVADGKLGPGGSLPTNTGGGQLSAYYMWGFTPLSEAVIQLRGQGGERQLNKNDFALVSGNGGFLNFHSTMVLGRHEPEAAR